MKNNSPKEILDKIKISKKILIPLHQGPDGDSFGCSVAMKYFLEKNFNKEVEVISKDVLDEVFSNFEFFKEVKFGKGVEDINLKKFDLIIFLDHGTTNFFGEESLDFPKDLIINIDHHETNSFFGGLNYVDSSRPSACSILIDLFREWKIKFDEELSTILLLGVYTDSGCFSHDNGGSLRDAVFLLDNGANYLEGIVNTIKYNVPLKMKKYFALLVDKFRVLEIGKLHVGVSAVSEKEINALGLTLAEVRGGINYLQEIGGIDILFTLTDMGDLIKGSFRSRKKINVSLFAKELGGGGHKFAAAFRLDKMSLEEAEKKVLEVIKKVGVHKVK